MVESAIEVGDDVRVMVEVDPLPSRWSGFSDSEFSTILIVSGRVHFVNGDMVDVIVGESKSGPIVECYPLEWVNKKEE